MEIKALVANSSSKERKNITQSLKEIGVRDVVEATDGKQAMEQLKNGKFDVIFAEFNTQCAQGEEFVKEARKYDGKLPIIVTAPKPKKVEELKKAYPNATKYITTPVTTDQLRKMVGEYAPSLAS